MTKMACIVATVVALTLATSALGGANKPPKVLNVCADAGKCYTSIQPAIDAAGDGDTVRIAAGTYFGSLSISKNISVVGAGSSLTTISAAPLYLLNRYRTVVIDTGATVTVKGVTVTHMNPGHNLGGAILNRGALTLRESNITENLEGFCYSGCQSRIWPADDPAEGGGIFTSGPLTLYNSTVSFNGAEQRGGGIYNTGATVTLFNSTVSHNNAAAFVGASSGGGIWSAGTMTLYDSDVSDNSTNSTINGGSSGGGIFNSATLVLRSSTVTGNRSPTSGGGISNGGTLSLYDTTITGNTASGYNPVMTIPYPGGGIINSGVLNVFDSVISGNTLNDCTQTSSSPPYYAECSL
jgi:hypothetical protein